jgi:hypothetical protein
MNKAEAEKVAAQLSVDEKMAWVRLMYLSKSASGCTRQTRASRGGEGLPSNVSPNPSTWLHRETDYVQAWITRSKL